MHTAEYKKGIVLTLGCYLIWGAFPIYWFPLRDLDPVQLMAQRICWSFLFISLLIIATGQLQSVLQVLKNKKVLLSLIATSQLLFVNWLTYLWAITNNHVLDASLGYFLTPLFSIFLGRIFLKERLLKLQYTAIIIASLGIIWLAWLGHAIPYTALILAISFGFYGLLKKMTPIKTLPGLALETLFMMPFAVSYLVHEAYFGRIAFTNLPLLGMLVLICSGVVTTIPLLLFSEGAKRIPLSLVGIIQYVSPTLQFLNGLFFFNELFSFNRFIGFLLIWVAVALFVFSEWARAHKAVRIAIKD